jgi:hypothetical protein
MRPRAFVVSPFGTKEVRAARDGEPAVAVDFDELYARILRPAIERAGCEAFRADAEPGAGDIRTDMLFELVTADAVVADISILNANVFYELGVRHGVAPRGVFLLHGGWMPRPFDVAPDRTFNYDGGLLAPSVPRDGAWADRVRAEAERLGERLEAALAVDGHGVGSPVYAALPGLEPADWSQVRTARARYFTGVLDDWRRRVRVARRNGRTGDILTLAEDAPTRFHRGELLSEASRGLVDLGRYRAARAVLQEVLELDPDNFGADCQLGQVLGRLGLAAEAREHMQRVSALRPADPEASGTLGRVYKDLWRERWDRLEDPAARRQAAATSAAMASFAARSYAAAYRAHLDYYNGINVVALGRLLEHLAETTGQAAPPTPVDHPADVHVAVRVAATAALKRAGDRLDGGDEEETIWATATLGELAVIEGDAREAVRWYTTTAAVPNVSYFQLDAVLVQLRLYERLGFQEEVVMAARQPLEAALSFVVEPARRFGKVFVGSGHMTDAPDRADPRFPPGSEVAVRERMAARLDHWGAGEGDLAICGGARGADILFAELCLERGAHVRLYLAEDRGDFLRHSVRVPGTDWEDRHFALLERCEVAYQPDRLGPPAPGDSVFARNNRWLINTAFAEADADPATPAAHRIHALLVWDESGGDGPGGTADFAQRLERLGGRLTIVNPARLDP